MKRIMSLCFVFFIMAALIIGGGVLLSTAQSPIKNENESSIETTLPSDDGENEADDETETNANINFSVTVKLITSENSWQDAAYAYMNIDWKDENDGGVPWGNTPSYAARYGHSASGGGSNSTYCHNVYYFSYSYGTIWTPRRHAHVAWYTGGEDAGYFGAGTSSSPTSYKSSDSRDFFLSCLGLTYSCPRSSSNSTLTGTYYAVLRKRYNNTYNLMGGSGVSTSQTTYAGIAYNLYGTPSKTGYVFGGWRETSASGAPIHAAGAYFGEAWADCSKTFEAIWTQKKYHLHFNANGGTITSNTAPYVCSHGMPELTYDTANYNSIGDIVVSRTGYNFNGWYTASSGGTKVYNADNSCTNNYIFSNNVCKYNGANDEIINVYAQWTVKTFKITVIKGNYGVSDITQPATYWNYNDGRDGKQITVNYGTSQTISVALSVGYSFSHWEGSSTSTSSSITCTVNEEKDYTFIAYAKPNNYAATFDPNGGEFNATGYKSTTEHTFNGSNYLNLGRTYMYTDKLYLSVEAYMSDWSVYANDAQRIISCTEGGGWNIESATSHKNIEFAIYDSGVGYKSIVTDKAWSSLSAGWHKFELSFDGQYARGYVDGILLGTSQKFSSGRIGYHSSNGVFVGAEAGASVSQPVGSYFIGKVRNLKILNTSKDKTVAFNSAYGTLPTPTRANYTFAGWRRNVYINPSETFETTSTHFVWLRDVGVNLISGRKYYLSFDLRLTSGVAEWAENYIFVNFRTMPKLYSAGKTTLDNATTTWQKYESEFTFTENNGASGELYDKDILHIYLKGDPNRQIRNLVIMEEIETTSTTIVGLAYDHTMIAQWTPTEITNKVCLRVISKDGNTVSTSNAGGSVSVTRNVISGATSSASTTTQTATEGTYASHQGQQFKLVASANSGYVFAGFSTSSTPSASIKQPASPPSNTFTAYPTSGTTYYVYFKQMSPNTLKYDETDKYFYFEDGYYPQSEANQELKFKDFNLPTASYASSTGLFTINANGVWGLGAELGVWEAGKDIDPFVAGQIYEVNIEHVSGVGVTDSRGGIYLNVYDKDGISIMSQYVSVLSSNTALTTTLTINSEGVAGKTLRLGFSGGGWVCQGTFRISVTRRAQEELEKGENVQRTDENISYNTGTSTVTLPVYSYGGQRYVKITKGSTTKWFKFEPIRWRISDYGVEKTERNISDYTSLYNLRNYTSYSTNFTAVSDLILGVGAMHDSRQTSEGMSVTAMKGFQFVEEMTNSMALNNHYAKSGNVIKVDSYSTVSQGNPTTTTSYAYSSAIRIASLEDISEVGLLNRQAKASDMVAFILGLDKDEVSYWTRDLSNLGSGIAITASGTQIRPWLDQMLGMRFAYTFSEGSNASFY